MAKSNVDIKEYAETRLPEEVKNWIAAIDKFMVENGCKVDASITMRGTNGRFSYTSRKSRKPVCIVYISPDGCTIALQGNHFIHPNHTSVNNILDELPKNMLDTVMKGAFGSCAAACINPDYSVNLAFKCTYGVADVFAHNGVKSFSCRHNPRFHFALDETADFEMLKKWIEYEIAWKAGKTT